MARTSVPDHNFTMWAVEASLQQKLRDSPRLVEPENGLTFSRVFLWKRGGREREGQEVQDF